MCIRDSHYTSERATRPHILSPATSHPEHVSSQSPTARRPEANRPARIPAAGLAASVLCRRSRRPPVAGLDPARARLAPQAVVAPHTLRQRTSQGLFWAWVDSLAHLFVILTQVNNRRMEAVAAGLGQQHRLVDGVEGGLQAGQVEGPPPQPGVVRPRAAAGPEDALPEEEFRGAMPGAHQLAADVFTGNRGAAAIGRGASRSAACLWRSWRGCPRARTPTTTARLIRPARRGDRPCRGPQRGTPCLRR